MESQDWDLRWTPPENLHLTLHFLGETPENLLVDLHHDLAALASAQRPFDLKVSGLGVFPSWEDPRVLWVGVEDRAGKLEGLFRASLKVLNAYRLFKLREDFQQPHLTLARVGRLGAAWDPRRALAIAGQGGDLGILRVDEFYLMKSELSPAGARYEVVEKFSLAH